ncbi:DUF6907 domain-containing protein [Streptomyces erythrochromogenes]|uniref:DUF6907 domain-containing protein n=1 Tax=Streptomyces erythrochromogenes TaxID=285574 RepID=UPI0037FB0D7C
MMAHHTPNALDAALNATGKAHPLLTDLPAVPAPSPITAAQRGADWIALYDCVGWCTLDHAGADGQPGWHQGPLLTAPAPAPNVNALPTNEPRSLFEARVTQTREEAAVWGIDSKIWLDCGGESMELTVAATDEFIASTEAFLLKLRGLRDHLAVVSRDDFPADEAKKAAYMAAQDARIKAIDAARAGE